MSTSFDKTVKLLEELGSYPLGKGLTGLHQSSSQFMMIPVIRVLMFSCNTSPLWTNPTFVTHYVYRGMLETVSKTLAEMAGPALIELPAYFPLASPPLPARAAGSEGEADKRRRGWGLGRIGQHLFKAPVSMKATCSPAMAWAVIRICDPSDTGSKHDFLDRGGTLWNLRPIQNYVCEVSDATTPDRPEHELHAAGQLPPVPCPRQVC